MLPSSLTLWSPNENGANKLSNPRLNQQLSSTESEGRLQSDNDIHPPYPPHHHPGTLSVVVVVRTAVTSPRPSASTRTSSMPAPTTSSRGGGDPQRVGRWGHPHRTAAPVGDLLEASPIQGGYHDGRDVVRNKSSITVRLWTNRRVFKGKSGEI